MANEPAQVLYRETLDSLLEGFQIIGFDWTYLYVNPAAAAQGRSMPEALQGRRMGDVYPGFEESPFFAELRRCMAERVTYAVENLFTYPDGSQRWFELRVEPVPEGLCIHSVDVDDRKRAQAALEQLNDELESLVRERTRELEELNSELEAFSHSVSHDLRAPVRHIAGFADVLVEDSAERLSTTDREHVERIRAAAQRMGLMIDGLLELSRLGRRPLEVQPVDLAEVIEQVRRDIAPDLENRHVVWNVGGLPAVSGDPTLLRAVMGNLLSNAVKYTRDRSPARIEISEEPRGQPNEAVICVRDNGAGFDTGAAYRLFGVFQRLHSDAEFEGTGVGLANVKRIVTRHGGRVWAEGREGEGAAFYVALPMAS